MSAEGATTYTELAVALGRVEEKVSLIVSMDDRLRDVEKTVERLEATQPKKTPWYLVATGVLAILTAATVIIALVALFAKIQ